MKYSFKFAQWKNSGTMIRASVYHAQNKRAVWVILCPGFTSHRIGPKYFYVSIARYLASNGISALSFDFSGTGESDGLFSDITISSLCSDLISACNFVKDRYKASKLVALGHSFGGTIAVLTAPQIPIDGLILISPLADTAKHARGQEHIVKHGINQDGYYEFGPHEMKIDFLNEFKKCNPVSALSSGFRGKLLLLQGDKDEQIKARESKAYAVMAGKTGIPCTHHIVKNGDHRFSSVQSRAFIQQSIVTWIKENII
jgi:fermentation-respiration switch protein FrsA (DUF1100 family)